MEFAKSNLALAQNIQVSRADRTLKHGRDDSQHPFGNPATTTCKVEVLGFASQPFGWFAFSRMMTLQARLTRNPLRIA
jgi:hypothetical protein